MSESYLEYLVQKKVGPLRQALKYCLFVATGLSFFVGLLRWPTLLLLGLIMAVVSYFFARNSAVEYEYLILGKELSVDRILGRSKRKKMREFDLARIEILAPAGSHRLDSYKDKKYTTYDFSSGDAQTDYCFIYENGNEFAKVHIDGTQEVLGCFRNISPRKVFTD